MSEKIVAHIKKIIFYNKENSYYILSCDYDEKELVIVGNFNKIEAEHDYEFIGEYVEHHKYGKQFKGYEASIVLPSQEDLFIKFLSSKQFVGIGKKSAKAIYDLYRDDESENILENILASPQKLNFIKNFSKSKQTGFLEKLQEQSSEQGLFTFLSNFQIDYQYIVNLYNKTGLKLNEFIKILKNDPYLLINYHIGFKSVDKFAFQLDIIDFDLKRACGYFLDILKSETFKTGSTYLDIEVLKELFFIEYPEVSIFEQVINLLSDYQSIVWEGNRIYEYQQYENECFIARFIREFQDEVDDKDIESYLKEYQDYHGIEFNKDQKQALEMAINNKIAIITGGPGTGKSTIVDALIKVCEKIYPQQKIGLVAPTGKASKRLSELTECQSMTIHKMLQYDMFNQTFGCNIFNPLEYDTLIIDEASMIDNILMGSLLKACYNLKRIIILGDYNQLPSVSQGQILKDLIDSQAVKTTFLKEIYRQKQGSQIIEFAYQILNRNNISNDFFNDEVELISYNDMHAIYNAINEYQEYENKDKFQIISPIYKGKLGIDNINLNMQKNLFKNSDKPYNIKDRVIQLKNRNDEEIYNGDVGEIEKIEENKMIVSFDNRSVSYNKMQQIDLKLAYCISVHKAQGNEYEKVVLFLPNYCANFIDNKILYTAVTRAKKKITIISELDIINEAIHNEYHSQRKTGLKDRLK